MARKKFVLKEDSPTQNEDDSQNTSTKFVPAYLKNPSFHYASMNLYSVDTSNVSKDLVDTNESLFPPKKIKNFNETPPVQIIVVRLKAETDEDFVEVDLDKANTTFEQFKEIIFRELDHIDKNFNIYKIRKLPNILIRNTNDIKRLKNEQEVEVFYA